MREQSPFSGAQVGQFNLPGVCHDIAAFHRLVEVGFADRRGCLQENPSSGKYSVSPKGSRCDTKVSGSSIVPSATVMYHFPSGHSSSRVRSVAEQVCGNEAAVHWVDGETGFFEGYDSEEAWLVLGGEYDRCVELESLEPYDGLADVYWDDPAVRGL